jgi:hypothetical protein
MFQACIIPRGGTRCHMELGGWHERTRRDCAAFRRHTTRNKQISGRTNSVMWSVPSRSQQLLRSVAGGSWDLPALSPQRFAAADSYAHVGVGPSTLTRISNGYDDRGFFTMLPRRASLCRLYLWMDPLSSELNLTHISSSRPGLQHSGFVVISVVLIKHFTVISKLHYLQMY